MENTTATKDFDERRRFDDRAVDDCQVGPARAVDVSGRCADCWGTASGTKEADGRWDRIECLACGRSVDGDNAGREADAMLREAEQNMAGARVGRPSRYREDARFVLKLLPDMDRDTASTDRRIETGLTKRRGRGRLTRHQIPPGTAGFLYAQSQAFLAGVANLPAEMSAIALSDFDYGEPHLAGSEPSMADGVLHATARTPVVYRRPSGRAFMARMGTALVAGMSSAFACEVGMKAILITRMDGAPMVHDLMELYRELPEDARSRLEADFPEIAEVLERSRETFGKWRYFEQGAGADAILALVDTDRVRGLGKAGRVIADECVVAGLDYDINVEATFHVTRDGDVDSTEQRIRLGLEGTESAVVWDEVLGAGEDG